MVKCFWNMRKRNQTRPPKRTVLLSLTELRERWRDSAIRAHGVDAVGWHSRCGPRLRRCGRDAAGG